MIVYALIGRSGSGKSHRAQHVSREYGIEYIIDDGLLINGTRVVAGKSAKKEETRLAAIRRAVFSHPDHRQEVISAIRTTNPSSILVLGTSDNMVDRILGNLNLPPVSRRIYIEEIATQREIETATRTRKEQGKHVIPVPTFAIKKDFSGYFIDSLKNLARREKGTGTDDIEKTVVRPTYSYLGKYTISNNVIKSMAVFVGEGVDGVHRVTRMTIDNKNDGILINMDIVVDYGPFIQDTAKHMMEYVKKELEHMTALNIIGINVNVKSINI